MSNTVTPIEKLLLGEQWKKPGCLISSKRKKDKANEITKKLKFIKKEIVISGEKIVT